MKTSSASPLEVALLLFATLLLAAFPAVGVATSLLQETRQAQAESSVAQPLSPAPETLAGLTVRASVRQ